MLRDGGKRQRGQLAEASGRAGALGKVTILAALLSLRQTAEKPAMATGTLTKSSWSITVTGTTGSALFQQAKLSKRSFMAKTEAVVSAFATVLRHEAALGDLSVHWSV